MTVIPFSRRTTDGGGDWERKAKVEPQFIVARGQQPTTMLTKACQPDLLETLVLVINKTQTV